MKNIYIHIDKTRRGLRKASRIRRVHYAFWFDELTFKINYRFGEIFGVGRISVCWIVIITSKMFSSACWWNVANLNLNLSDTTVFQMSSSGRSKCTIFLHPSNIFQSKMADFNNALYFFFIFFLTGWKHLLLYIIFYVFSQWITIRSVN